MRRLLLVGRTGVPVVAALFVLATLSDTAHAQASSDRRIRVAVPDRFPVSDARALVVRYGSVARPDVILLNPRDVTSDAVAAALALLRRLDKERPLAPGRYSVATLKGFAPLGGANAVASRELGNQLALLRAQPRSRIGNLGPGRWIELHHRRSRS